MLRCLTGVVRSHTSGSVVIDVGGVGYLVHVTDDWIPPAQETTLWTHLAVRETSLDLYGFSQQTQCRVFEALLTVPKIGPKSALQILNKASIPLLFESIKTQDPSGLSKRSGVGLKTAEKIVQELQEHPCVLAVDSETVTDSTNEDAVATLIALGYNERTAHEVIRDILRDHKDADTQSIVRLALKQISTY